MNHGQYELNFLDISTWNLEINLGSKSTVNGTTDDVSFQNGKNQLIFTTFQSETLKSIKGQAQLLEGQQMTTF